VKLGHLNAGGFGVLQNIREAERLYRAAADQGDPEGMQSLGYIHERYVEIRGDAEAALWDRPAAGVGDLSALNDLANLYESGRGVGEVDIAKARRLWREAADQGELFAMENLGRSYLWSGGNLHDFDAGMTWLRRAVAADHGPALRLM